MRLLALLHISITSFTFPANTDITMGDSSLNWIIISKRATD